jgi:phosphoglycolate phosphatase-like HAD superfamily hydrolase
MGVFCFDFDGVVCDSAPETALSAWRACRELWPELPETLPGPALERFCRLRPVMHTGFEAIPLMRLIVLGQVPDERFFAAWDALRDQWIRDSGLAKPDLLKRFGAQRDRMIALDAPRWLELNPFYESMAALLTAAAQRHEVFIITTKQERFARLLLTHHGVPLSEERVFGLERNLPKPAVLRELMGRAGLAGQAFHFIEDRLETLQDVILQRPLDPVQLYLVDWGYNTPLQRRQAAREPRIEVVTRDRLAEVCGQD